MRNPRAVALIVALSVMVAACGNNGPTTGPNGPAITPAPSQDAVATVAPPTATVASPEPSPVDVAALTAATVADPEFTAKVALDAQTKLGTARTATTGRIDIDGRTSHLVRRDKVGKETTTTETITGNGTRFAKLKGVWTKAGSSDDTELVAVLRAIPTMTDLGVEDKDGVQLHHLQTTTIPAVPKELSPAKEVTELTNTLDAWVTEAGVPVTMTLVSTWKQTVAKKTVSGSRTANLAWSEVGGDVTVTVPTDIWKFYTSKRYHYRMGYPETWEVKPGSGRFADGYYGGEEYVYASRARQTRATLSFLTRGILDSLKSITGYKSLKVTANRKATLDGVPARRVEFRGTSSGERVYGQAVYAIKGAFWYFVGFDAYVKQDKETRALFTKFIKSYDFK